MSTETTMLPYQKLGEAVHSYFPEQPDKHDAIANQLVSLCQIPAGSTEITQVQYDKALMLMEAVKSGEAGDLRKANDLFEGNVTEVEARPTDAAQRLDELSDVGADRIAEELDGVDEALGGRIVQRYTTDVMRKLPAAMERARAKKQAQGGGAEATSAYVTELVDRLLGLPPSSSDQKALPQSDD